MLERFTRRERVVVFEAVRAAANGPFFSAGEVAALSGLDRRQLQAVASRIPRLDDSDPVVRRVIGHALCDLLSHPEETEAHWTEWLTATRSELEGVAERWMAWLRSQNPSLA